MASPGRCYQKHINLQAQPGHHMHIQPIEQFKSQSLNARGFDIDMSTKYILSHLKKSWGARTLDNVRCEFPHLVAAEKFPGNRLRHG